MPKFKITVHKFIKEQHSADIIVEADDKDAACEAVCQHFDGPPWFRDELGEAIDRQLDYVGEDTEYEINSAEPIDDATETDYKVAPKP